MNSYTRENLWLPPRTSTVVSFLVWKGWYTTRSPWQLQAETSAYICVTLSRSSHGSHYQHIQRKNLREYFTHEKRKECDAPMYTPHTWPLYRFTGTFVHCIAPTVSTLYIAYTCSCTMKRQSLYAHIETSLISWKVLSRTDSNHVPQWMNDNMCWLQ